MKYPPTPTVAIVRQAVIPPIYTVILQVGGVIHQQFPLIPKDEKNYQMIDYAGRHGTN